MASTAQAAGGTYTGTTCNANLVSHLKSILAFEGASTSPTTATCIDVEIDLSIVYDEEDFPITTTCEESDGDVGLMVSHPAAVQALKTMITNASQTPPAGSALRISITSQVVYDEEDFPICGE